MKSDRYTVITVHNNDIPEKLKAIHALGLRWFIARSDRESNSSEIYIFFDYNGMQNYLNEVYGSVANQMRAILR